MENIPELLFDKRINLYENGAPHSDLNDKGFVPCIYPMEVKGSDSAVIVCPGGGYVMKMYTYEGKEIAEYINNIGISAFVLDYTVNPSKNNGPVKDALTAVRIVRAMGYKKVGIMGFSAGGHLCLSAATLYNDKNSLGDDNDAKLCRPDFCIPCYAVAELERPYAHEGSVEALLGPDYENAQLRHHYTAKYNVTPNTPPMFIWHTVPDDCVPPQNSLNLAAALKQNDVSFSLHLYPEGGHGQGPAKDIPCANLWIGEMLEWLKYITK